MKFFLRKNPVEWAFNGETAILQTSEITYAIELKNVLEAHNIANDYETKNPTYFSIKILKKSPGNVRLIIEGDMKTLKEYIENIKIKNSNMSVSETNETSPLLSRK